MHDRAARGLEGHEARAGQLRPRPALDQVGRSHEVGDERVAGQVVDLGRGPGLLDRAVAHDHDAVRDREGLLQVVGDVHRRDPERPLQLLDLEPHLGAQLRVQVAEGLVEEQHRGPEHEGAREGHPLLLAARELRGAAGGQLAHLHEAERPRDPLPELRLRHLPHPQAVGHVVEHGHVGPDRVGLEHHRESPLLGRHADARGGGEDRLAVDPNLARLGRLEPGDGPQGGGLAAARRTQQGHVLAGGHREGDPAHRGDRPVADDQVADLDRGGPAPRAGRLAHAIPPPAGWPAAPP